MPPSCSIWRHPEKASIEDQLIRNVPLRKIAMQVGTMATSLFRHRKHLSSQLVMARNVEAVVEATSLLNRVEKLIKESEQEKDWPAATTALREARSCLELLAKLGGELQQPGSSLHLHRHAHLHTGSRPRTESEVEIEIARLVSVATENFNSKELARLKRIAETSAIAASLSSQQWDGPPFSPERIRL
jgi:hypothetical protein